MQYGLFDILGLKPQLDLHNFTSLWKVASGKFVELTYYAFSTLVHPLLMPFTYLEPTLTLHRTYI